MISDFLKPGANNAIKAKDLERLTGYSRRELYKMIAEERKNGSLILARRDFDGGFFLPSVNDQSAEYELQAHISATKSIIKELEKSIEPMSQELNRLRQVNGKSENKKNPSRFGTGKTDSGKSDNVNDL